MKKVNIIMLAGCMFFMLGCNKVMNNEGSAISALPSESEIISTDYEESTEPLATLPVETTTDPGIMPNSAGIVITNTDEEETTRPSAESAGIILGVANDTDKRYSAEEDAKKLGVSKILVYAVAKAMAWNLDPDIMHRVNELLVNEYDCDYVVEFVAINGLKPYGDYVYDILAYSKEMKEHVDIIQAWNSANYSRLVREDFFADMTEYFSTTDLGGNAYKATSKENWDSVTRSGRIYGYSSYSVPSGMYAVICNRDNAEKLGLKVNEGFSFYDIGDLLSEIDFSQENAKGMLPLYMNGTCAYRMLNYSLLEAGIFGKKDAEGRWIAFNFAEDEEFIKLFKTICQYKENGWLRTGENAYDTFTQGKFLFSVTGFNSYDISYAIIGNKLRTTITDRVNWTEKEAIYDIISGKKYYAAYGYRETFISGVTSWSEYKNEAMNFLALLNTEEKLGNLLAYGIENVHYTYRDSVVIKLPSSTGKGLGDIFPVSNPNLLLSQYIEPEDKAEYYLELSSEFERGPIIDVFCDYEEWNAFLKEFEQLEILEQIYEQGYEKLVNGEYEDVDSALAEIVRLQREAGIYEIIDAYNEKFFDMP